MKDFLKILADMDDDEKAGAIFGAVIVGIILSIMMCFAYVMFTDEYTVKKDVDKICILWQHNIEDDQVSSKCAIYKFKYTYTCEMINGESFANCKDSKRCEEVCDKLRSGE